MEKVSIIVPAFNAEKTIARCIKSILNQSYRNIELIIINDGSSDNTIEIIENFERQDTRIELIDKLNEGVSIARNKGLKKATGKYILFVDSDDEIHSEMVKALVDIIEKDESDLAICGYDVINASNESKVESIITEECTDLLINLIEPLFNQSLLFMIWNKIYIREKINCFFSSDVSLGEDVLFNLNYLFNVNKVSIVDKPLYMYYLSNDAGLHLKFHQEDNEVDNLIYFKLDEILNKWGSKSLIANIIYFDAVQRTVQRLIFENKYDFRFIKKYIKKILDQELLHEVIKDTKFLNFQNRFFSKLFKYKLYHLIYVSFYCKKKILSLVRK